MTIDYLIIGQGISGSFLSRDLLRAGKTVCVVDERKPFTASKVASGVINPITGRRLVRTWEIEKLMPYAVSAYTEWGNAKGKSLIRQCNILDFHPTPQMVLAFAERQPVEKEYLQIPENTDHWKKYFNYSFSIGEIDPCWLIDINTLLFMMAATITGRKKTWLKMFSAGKIAKLNPYHVTKNITAQKIICCEGVAGFDNPYFHLFRMQGIRGRPSSPVFRVCRVQIFTNRASTSFPGKKIFSGSVLLTNGILPIRCLHLISEKK
jgi:UDP-glucose 4-epimerase